MIIFKKLRHNLQPVLKRIIPALLKLTMPRLVVMVLTIAMLVSAIMVLTIDFLWDGRFNTELEFAAIIVTFFDGLLIVGLLAAFLSELREELKRSKRVQEEVEYKNTVLQTQQETSLDAILVVDENAKIISYNQQFIDLWRLSPHMVSAGLDGPVLQSVANQVENSEAFVANIQWLYEHRNNKSQVEIPLKDGRIIDRHSAPVTGTHGKYYGRIWYFRDITELKKAEAELRIAAIAFESQEGMLVADANNVILRVNNAFSVITGYTANEVVGQNPRILSSGSHDANFYAAMWDSINRNGGWEGEIYNRRKTGEIYPQQLTITAVKDTKDIVINYVATFTDITIRKNLELELTRQAHLDYLTGLSNRRHFIEQGEIELSRAIRYDTPLSLMMLDIDFFKKVNDTYGHQVGDIVLQSLSKICQYTLRQVDVAGRLGGEEFAVILPETTCTEALEVAERLRKAIASTEVTIPVDLSIHFTVSIGVTTLLDKNANIDMLLNQADKALYEAKETGRNKVCVE
jgi:diguanylate cyclase (GGDEF)-like protein/PAS domain S-box-containing protein